MKNCEREDALGRMLALLESTGETRKTAFTTKMRSELGISRNPARQLLDEAVRRGLVSATRRPSPSFADRPSIFLARTDVAFVPMQRRPESPAEVRAGENAACVLPVAEVWMTVPGVSMPFEVSNYGRLRKIVHDKDAISRDAAFGYEMRELEYDEVAGRYGWNVNHLGGDLFLDRDDLMRRFIGVRRVIDRVEEIDALKR